MIKAMKTVEAIKNGQEVAVEDIFQLVNAYEITTLNASDKNGSTLLQVNKYESYDAAFEFSRMCDDFEKYVLTADKIKSVKGEYNPEMDAIYITVDLTDENKVQLLVFHITNGFKDSVKDGIRESDAYELKDFLESVLKEDSDWYCALTRITDVFGFDFKMNNPIRTFVDTLDNEHWKLHISDDSNTFTVPVVDDGCNYFYMRESDSNKEIIVKPYGQSFMDIEMLFFKKHSK